MGCLSKPRLLPLPAQSFTCESSLSRPDDHQNRFAERALNRKVFCDDGNIFDVAHTCSSINKLLEVVKVYDLNRRDELEHKSTTKITSNTETNSTDCHKDTDQQVIKDIPVTQSNFRTLVQRLFGIAQRTLQDMLLRHIGKLQCEIGEFLENHKHEIQRLRKRKDLTSKDYYLLFQENGSLTDVHRLNSSILCKLLLNMPSFKVSEKEKQGVKMIQTVRRWVINRPSADVTDNDFSKKCDQMRAALSLIEDGFCNKDGRVGFREELSSNGSSDGIQNIILSIFDVGTDALRRCFLQLTNHNPELVLNVHRSKVERLLEKGTLNAEQWNETFSSGRLDLSKASFSQLCTLLQTVCGDLPTCLSGAITKFQQLRMRILHHGSDTLTDSEFHNYQNDLNMCMAALEQADAHAEQDKNKEEFVKSKSGSKACRDVNSPDTSASEDEVLDTYFAQKARCGGSVPLDSSEPVRKSDGFHMMDRHGTTRSSNQIGTTKRQIQNMLRSVSTAVVSDQPQGGRKCGQFRANVVYMSQPINTKPETDFNDRMRSTEDVGTEYELDERITESVWRQIKYLPSNRLPWPQIDMEAVVAHVQHDPLDIIFNIMASPNPPGPQTTMKYELLRLCTYRNFPYDDKPYLIRLAAAGFYYAGEDDEVTCYCCGQRKSGWTSADVPVNVHSMLSPACVFFSKNLDVNVPVPHPPDTRPNRTSLRDLQQESGAFGQAAAAATAPAFTDVKKNPPSEASTQPHQTALKHAERRRPRSNMAFQTTSHPLQVNNATDTNVYTNVNQAVSQQAGLGIDFESPKHPQYAVKAVRMQSFDNWPRNVHQTPQELAEAGLYYAGFGDCVRCFFCGIGLRHWSEEDNPWIEHARWSARCVFLRQVKGDEFVDLVQLAVQYSNEEDEDVTGNPQSADTNELVVRQQPPKNDAPNYLLTDAAQSVLEMGYQPRMVQKAIDIVLRQKGREYLTATSIMEHVLELEEAEETVKVQHTMEKMNLNEPESNGNKSIDADKKVDTEKILQQNKELKDQTLCKVCLDNPVCIVFLPCGHLVTCAECAPAMRKCPICRAIVKGTVKTYMA